MHQAHDAALAKLRVAATRVSLAAAADAFLASLSTRELSWRGALPAVVMARHLPVHPYTRQSRYASRETCGVCGFDPVFGHHGVSPDHLAQQIDALGSARPRPTSADIAAFNGVLARVKEQQRLSIDGRVRRAELVKALSPVIKSDKYERMELLDALGRCSILATSAAPGFLRQYVAYDAQSSGAGNNEFAWPFALWTAADGFHADAVGELFPHPGIDVGVSAKPPAAFDEPAARQEMEARAKRARSVDDELERVVFAPGGLWIARLTNGHFGLLYKAARRGRWVSGSRDDVLASVPDAMFAEAVAALRGAP